MAAPKLQYSAGNAASTTTSSSMTNSDTATPLTSTTNFQAAPTPGEGMLLLDEGAATEEIAYGTGLSGGSVTTPLANRGLEGGSAQAHASGASVKGILTAGMWNNLITALLNVLVQSSGALDTTKVVDLSTAQTLTNKTLTTPIIATISNTGTVTLPTSTDTLVGRATTDTLTNKRRTRRVVTTTQSATPTINTDNTDVAVITGLAQAITSFTTNLSGTANDGDLLEIDITDNGTARALTFGASFKATTVALPTTTVISTKLNILFKWSTVDSAWLCVAVA
jgi:hypothetical protein